MPLENVGRTLVHTATGTLVGAALGAAASAASEASHHHPPEGEWPTGVLVGGLIGAFGGFVHGASASTDAAGNLVAAISTVGKAVAAGALGLDVILPLQFAVTTAVAGYVAHLKGGPLTKREMLAVKMTVAGFAFDGAARNAGVLIGSAQAIFAAIDKLCVKLGYPIRSPSSPLMPALMPDVGALVFAIVLGMKVNHAVLSEFNGTQQPPTAATAFEPDWSDLASAIAAGAGVAAAIILTTFIHGKPPFALIPPPEPGDVLYSRGEAVVAAFGAAPIAFGLRWALGKDGLFDGLLADLDERLLLKPEHVAGMCAAVFANRIFNLSYEYLVQGMLLDRGGPAEGQQRPIGALAGMNDDRVAVPLATMRGRAAQAHAMREQVPNQTSLLKHLSQLASTFYQVALTTVVTGIALRAAAEHSPFAMSQEDVVNMATADEASQAVAGVLAAVMQMAGGWAITKLFDRADPESRLTMACWVGQMIAAVDVGISELTGEPFLQDVAPAVAGMAVLSEIVHRYRHRNDDTAGYRAPGPGYDEHVGNLPAGTDIPGAVHRFLSYFRLAWDGMPQAPAAAVASAANADAGQGQSAAAAGSVELAASASAMHVHISVAAVADPRGESPVAGATGPDESTYLVAEQQQPNEVLLSL